MQASLTGEVSVESLKPFMQAGASVYELMDEIEQRRFLHQNLSSASSTASTAACATLPLTEQQAALCTWNAFALQTLGDALLRPAELLSAPEVFLPAVTAEQARRYFTGVTGWLRDAHLSYADATYQPTEPLPSRLPAWVSADSFPAAHLAALLEALSSLSTRLNAAALDFEQKASFLGFGPVRDELLGRVEAAEAQARYARDLYHPPLGLEALQTVQDMVQRAIEEVYLTGQVLYMPALLPRVRQQEQSAASAANTATPRVDAKARPSSAGERAAKPASEQSTLRWKSEPWCISDPRIAALIKSDPKLRVALQEMWQQLKRPHRAYEEYRLLLAAFERDDLQYAVDSRREPLGHDHEPPYGAVYVVVKDCTLLGQCLKAGQIVMMSRGPGRGGREFRMVVGEFEAAAGVEYEDVSGPEDSL